MFHMDVFHSPGTCYSDRLMHNRQRTYCIHPLLIKPNRWVWPQIWVVNTCLSLFLSFVWCFLTRNFLALRDQISMKLKKILLYIKIANTLRSFAIKSTTKDTTTRSLTSLKNENGFLFLFGNFVFKIRSYVSVLVCSLHFVCFLSFSNFFYCWILFLLSKTFRSTFCC